MHSKTLAAGLAAAVSLTLIVGATPAQAADSVTIKTISSKTAKYKKTITVKPSVSTSGKVKVYKKTFTVKKGKKTVAKDKTSTKLKAGTYNVKTTVKYKTYKNVSVPKLAVNAGDSLYGYEYWDDAPPGFTGCTVTTFRSSADFDISCELQGATVNRAYATSFDIVSYWSGARPSGAGDPVDVETLRAPENIYEPVTQRKYSSYKTKSRSQSLKIKQGKKPPKPAKCATYKNFKKVKNDMTVSKVKTLLGPSKVQYSGGGYVNREYKPCKKYDYFVVLFEDGYVWDKVFSG